MPTRFRCPPHLLERSLQNKLFVVTGVSRGLGRALCHQLLKQGAMVIGISRSIPEYQHPNFTWESVDLSDLMAVHCFAEYLTSQYRQIDGLINNAATIPTEHRRTKDGLELQWTTNYLSAVLLTECLRPLYTADTRILQITSSAHHAVQDQLAYLDFDDLHFEKRQYQQWVAYAQSKLALTLYLQISSEHHNTMSVGVHPGWVDTGIAKSKLHPFLFALAYPYLRHKGLCTIDEGIQPMLFTLLAPVSSLQSGQQFCQLGFYDNAFGDRPHVGWLDQSPNPIVYDKTIQERLWTITRTQLQPWITF